jgi:hypothetical protein
MTMSTLHSTILHLASQFATGILEAIRGASLEDILAETSGGRAGARASHPEATVGGTTKRKSGRLPRRSAGDISSLVESIVGLLQSKPEGMRAEEIRSALGLEAKELPRPIAEALASQKISKKGQKRATTYFARGAGGKASPKPARGSKKAAKRGKVARGGRKAKKAQAAASAETSGK